MACFALDLDVFSRLINSFLIRAASAGVLRKTFHDFGERDPYTDMGGDFRFLKQIVVTADGIPMISSWDSAPDDAIPVGWPWVTPEWTDPLGESDDLWEERRRAEFEEECRSLLTTISEPTLDAIDCCGLTARVELAWDRLTVQQEEVYSAVASRQ